MSSPWTCSCGETWLELEMDSGLRAFFVSFRGANGEISAKRLHDPGNASGQGSLPLGWLWPRYVSRVEGTTVTPVL